MDNKIIKVLLVDDDQGDVHLTRESLKQSKVYIDLDVVENGEEAMKYLKQEAPYKNTFLPDLILLDLNMPKKDGRQTLKEIKGDSVLKSIPVIILTTSSAEVDIEKSYFLGANCFVSKPVDFNQFLKVVNTLGDFWFTVVRLPSSK